MRTRPVVYPVRLSEQERDMLDAVAKQRGFSNGAELVRDLIRTAYHEQEKGTSESNPDVLENQKERGA